MGKTYVDYETWSGLTGGFKQSVHDIGTLASLNLSKTDLAPFTGFDKSIEAFNQSLTALKSYIEADSSKMNQAAENKLKDDQKEASNIQQGGK